MSQESVLREHIADIHIQITGIVPYGVQNVAGIIGGLEKPPPSGALLDAAIAGQVRGPRLSAEITNGVDYITVRADGHAALDIRATLTTEDSCQIAYRATGVGYHDGKAVQIRLSASLFSLAEPYLWVNDVPLWVFGEVDPGQRALLRAYAV